MSDPMDALGDVPLEARLELGRVRRPVEEILKLAPGSVVELDRAVGEPADLYVNDRLVARGEILVVDGQFAIRIIDVVSPPAK